MARCRRVVFGAIRDPSFSPGQAILQPADLSLADPKPILTIGVLWRKEHPHSRATGEFVRLLRKASGVAEV